MNFMPAMNDYGDVDRRRMLGQTLMQGGMNMVRPWCPLASIFGGLAGRYADKREKQLMADERPQPRKSASTAEALTRGGTSEMDIARARCVGQSQTSSPKARRWRLLRISPAPEAFRRLTF